MAFKRRNRNRRKLDAEERKAALAGAFRARGLPVLRVLGVLVLLGATGVAGREVWRWMLSSPRFALRTVTFNGLARASEPELVRMSGLVPGQNLFLLDLDHATKALQSHPWIRRARVLRELPTGIRVDIEEHVAVAMATLGDLYLVNAEGEPFKKIDAEDALDLPILSGMDRDAYLQDGETVSARFRDAVALIAAYEASGASRRARISEVRVSKTGGGRIAIAENGQELHFTEGSPEEALRRLFKVRAELSRRGLQAQVIHLDNRVRPDRVTVKLVGSELREDSARVKVASARE